MRHLRTVGFVLTAVVTAAGCGAIRPPRDGAADGSRDGTRPDQPSRADSTIPEAGADHAARDSSSTDHARSDGRGGDATFVVPGAALREPLIDCFEPQPTGCVRGVLESAVSQYWGSPYGQGPRFLSPQTNLTVRGESPMPLAAGTLYFWARHFDPIETGQTHVLVQIAMVDSVGQVDTDNRAHVLFRDGNLEGLVAQDTVQVGPLGQRADWVRDVIAPGEWHQYALSWDQREISLFVDGGLLMHKPRSTSGMTASFPRVCVGARFDGSYPADSQIARLLLWKERLPHPDIQRMFLADLQAVKLPVVVQAAASDSVPRDRLELSWGSTLPVLDFHVTAATEIGPGGRVLVGFPHSSGEFFGEPPWKASVNLPAGVTGSVTCATVPRLPLAKSCTVTIADGTVAPSTDIVLHLTDVPLGGKATITRKGASNLWPRVFVDCGGEGSCSGALLPVTTQPSLAFLPSPNDSRAAVFARIPSTARVGEPFSMHLWAEKSDSAPDLGAAFAVSFTAIPELVGLPSSYAFVAGDDGSAEIAGLTFAAVPSRSPLVQIHATTSSGELIEVNPVEVAPSTATLRLFVGDMHLHSTYSDGKEVPAGHYPFARSRGLDFAAISDHINTGDVYATPWEFNHTMDVPDWQELQRLARAYNVPGSFVTLLAFEESAGSIGGPSDCPASGCPPNEGDWNVYFSSDSAPLLDAASVFESDGLLATLQTVDPLAVVIPHFGGRRANLLGLTLDQNRARVPVVEIISNHTAPPDGAESWATQTLASPIRLGFIASSDDHSGHPGRSMWGTRYGYVAAWAESLDRTAILDALRRRHTYACSHSDHPIVRVSANRGSMMGDSVTLAEGEDPAMTLAVESRVPVSSVSLRRDGAEVWQSSSVGESGSAPYAIAVPYTESLPKSPANYYWKITFADSAVVWTSPIWFER
jgi:hypothetical protein